MRQYHRYYHKPLQEYERLPPYPCFWWSPSNSWLSPSCRQNLEYISLSAKSQKNLASINESTFWFVSLVLLYTLLDIFPSQHQPKLSKNGWWKLALSIKIILPGNQCSHQFCAWETKSYGDWIRGFLIRGLSQEWDGQTKVERPNSMVTSF